jgi:hypothetical protein
MQTFK